MQVVLSSCSSIITELQVLDQAVHNIDYTCTYTRPYGNSDCRNYKRKNKEKRVIILSPSPHIKGLTSMQNYQLLVYLKEKNRGQFDDGISTMKFCSVFKPVMLLERPHFCETTSTVQLLYRALALRDETTNTEFLTSLLNGTLQITTTLSCIEDKENPSTLLSLFLVHQLGSFGFLDNVVFFFRIRMSKIS